MTSLAMFMALLAQSLTIAPDVIPIPITATPSGKWPDFETSATAGRVTLTATYVVGPAIAAGGGVEFAFGYSTPQTSNPAYSCNGGAIIGPTIALARFVLGLPQTSDPTGPDYCTASTPGVKLTVTAWRRPDYDGETWLRVTTPMVLTRGTAITIILGAGSGMVLPWNCGTPKLLAMEDRAGVNAWTRTAAVEPRVLFTGAHADRFIVNGPMVAVAGQPFEVSIRAVQGADGPLDDPLMPVEFFSAPVHVEATDPFAVVPAGETFVRGVARLVVALATPGVQTLTVLPGPHGTTSTHGPAGMSNSILVVPAGDSRDVLCGDLQRHCCEGGHAAVTQDECWKDLYDQRQDFGAVVEHSELPMSGFTAANAARNTFQATVGASFVALPGYEWTLPGAHRHVVYQNGTSDPSVASEAYRGFELPAPTVMATVPDLLAQLATMASDRDHVAIVHHSIWNGPHDPPFDWTFDWGPVCDDPIQPLVEVYSCHGSSEVWLARANASDDYPIIKDVNEQRPKNNLASVRDALKLGYRLGIVGGSDCHSYRVGCSKGEADGAYTRGGLTMCVAPRDPLVSRRARIWNALKERRTYATTGARIYLSWTAVDGTGMGGETSLSIPSFGLEVHASGIGIMVRPSLTRADVVRDDQVVGTTPFSASDATWTWADPAALNDGKFHSYYVRVVQSDDHVAWSSPIWVKGP